MTVETIRKTTEHFLDTIEKAQLFARVSITDHYYFEIHERIQTSVKILDKKLSHMDNDKKIDYYFAKMGELGFTSDEVVYDSILHVVSLGISVYEVSKMFLFLILDKSKIDVQATTPLGTLIIELGKKLYSDKKLIQDLFDFFDVKFRNRLAHEKWWCKNKLFYYVDEDNNTVKQLTMSELQDKFVHISTVSQCLSEIYQKKYESKYTK